MANSRLYSALSLAGATPFLACALLPLLGINAVPPFGSLDTLAASYGLAIICFLAGIHWLTHLSGNSPRPFNLFISSNIVFLSVWFTFVAASLEWALLVQIVALQFLLFIDFRLRQNAVISSHYFAVRTIATVIASLSLLAILLF